MPYRLLLDNGDELLFEDGSGVLLLEDGVAPMTAPSFTFPQAVRDFLDLDVDATSKYTDQTIGSNIRQASWMLERATNRLYGDRTGTLRKFTTNDAAYVTIPGLRTATSVTFAGSDLTADSSYWLIPDVQQTGVYTGLQLRGFQTRSGGPSYLAYSDWFDTNKDNPKWAAYGSLPNDLQITGDWGYAEADLPEPVRFATKVLAAFLTKYPDAVLAGSIQTANGGTIDFSGWPLPVQEFIASWSLRQGVAGA